MEYLNGSNFNDAPKDNVGYGPHFLFPTVIFLFYLFCKCHTMWTIPTSIIVAFAFAVLRLTLSEEEKKFQVAGLDSYLEAYRESQETNSNESVHNVKSVVKKSDREFTEWNSYNGYPSAPE